MLVQHRKGRVVPINFHPRPGQILMCNFDGLMKPKMVKTRPVLVVSSLKDRAELVTIVALSTTPPSPVKPFHLKINRDSMPQTGYFQAKDMWLKGDTIYTLCFQRLDLIKMGKRGSDGKRLYFKDRLGRDIMRDTYGCVLHGLGIGEAAAYLRGGINQ